MSIKNNSGILTQKQNIKWKYYFKQVQQFIKKKIFKQNQKHNMKNNKGV